MFFQHSNDNLSHDQIKIEASNLDLNTCVILAKALQYKFKNYLN
jgi:hypothetical protein